jgi:NhaP-type Na+/H+ or K+/H+ antiporter
LRFPSLLSVSNCRGAHSLSTCFLTRAADFEEADFSESRRTFVPSAGSKDSGRVATVSRPPSEPVKTGHHTDEITLELTRIVIALSVFAVGVELPRCQVRGAKIPAA